MTTSEPPEVLPMIGTMAHYRTPDGARCVPALVSAVHTDDWTVDVFVFMPPPESATRHAGLLTPNGTTPQAGMAILARVPLGEPTVPLIPGKVHPAHAGAE